MKRYPRDNDMSKVKFFEFKIIAKSERDRKELMNAFKHIHDSSIDTEYIAVNQLAHLYLDVPHDPCRIVVDKTQF